MRVINRTAVTVLGVQPYIDWTLSRDASFAKGKLMVARTRPYGSAFLLPEVELEEELREWVEENYQWIFELQLAEWTEDESAWPQGRDLEMFRQWFRIELHSTVVDVVDEEIAGVEL